MADIDVTLGAGAILAIAIIQNETFTGLNSSVAVVRAFAIIDELRRKALRYVPRRFARAGLPRVSRDV